MAKKKTKKAAERTEPTAPAPTVAATPGAGGVHFVDLRKDWPHLLGVAAMALGVYVFTMPRAVTLEDSGLFIMSASSAGVAHPPGYPLHSLLGKLFTLFPVGTVAFRVHLFSAVCAAAAAAVLFCLVHALTGKKPAAWSAALGLAVSRELWAQSIIAEVYSLNVLLCLLLLLLCLHFQVERTPRALWAAALVAGLSLAHHWPLAVLVFPGAALLLWPARRALVPALPRAVPFLLLGLLPVAWMVVRSNQNPPISFYGPLDSFERFWFFVSRKGYAEMDQNLGATVADQLSFAGFFFKEAVWQLTPLGALLAAGGAVVAHKKLPRTASLALWAVFLGGSLLLVALLHRRFGFLERAVFKVYPLMPYAVLAVWAGLALAEVEDRLKGMKPRWGALGAGLLGAVMVAATFASGLHTNQRSGDTWAHDYAKAVFEAVEPDAIIVAGEDTDTGPLGELHHVEGVQPGVALYNAEGLVFQNRLVRPPATASEKARALKELVESAGRPVYLVSDNTQSPFGTVELGLLRKVSREEGASFAASAPLLALCGRIVTQTALTDAWAIDHRHRLLRRCGMVLAGLVHKAQPPRDDLRPALEAIEKTYAGTLGVAETLAPGLPPKELLALADRAAALADDTVPHQGRAMVEYLRGFALYQTDLKAALAAFERSLDFHPEPSNGAALALLQLHAAAKDKAAYWKVRERIWAGKPATQQVKEMDRTVGR